MRKIFPTMVIFFMGVEEWKNNNNNWNRHCSPLNRRRKWQPTPVFLLGRIPGTEEPDGLQRVGHN